MCIQMSNVLTVLEASLSIGCKTSQTPIWFNLLVPRRIWTELFLKLFKEKIFLFYTLNVIRKFSLKKGYPFTGVEHQTTIVCKARQIPIQFNFLVLGFFNGNFSWHANWCNNVEVSFSDSLICLFNQSVI